MIPTATPETNTRRADPGSHRIALVLAGIIVLVAGLTLGFVVTAIGATRTGELDIDVAIAHHRSGALTTLAMLINVACGTLVAPLVLLAACGILWTRSRSAALALGGLTIVGWLSVEIGKAVVHRPRPPAAAVHALVAETAADSYPSGHTAFAAATVFAVVAALVLTGRRTRLAWLIGLPVVAAVGVSRLYLGVHYLTDVVASVLFAGASVLLAAVVARPFLLRFHDGESRRSRE